MKRTVPRIKVRRPTSPVTKLSHFVRYNTWPLSESKLQRQIDVSLATKVADAMKHRKKLKKNAVSFGPHTVSVLKEIVAGQDKPIKKKGEQINNTAVGTTTETYYESQLLGSKSKSLERALALAEKGSLEKINQGRIVSATESQAFMDLCFGNDVTVTNLIQQGSATEATKAQPGGQIFPQAAATFVGNFINPSSSAVYNGDMQILANMFYDTTANASSYFHYTDATVELMLRNVGDFGVSIDIYECVLKRDVEKVTSATSVSNDTVIGGLVSPFQYMVYGLTQLATSDLVSTNDGVSKSLPSTTSLGTQPTNAPFFNRYWLIDSHVTINMGPNSTHKHTAKYNVSKTFNRTDINFNSGYAGLTRNILMRIQGYPNPSDIGVVSIAPACVTWVAKTKMHARAFSASNTYNEVITTV